MRDKARRYFEECNLSYEIISMNDLYRLIKILNKKISETNNYLIMMNEPRLKGKNRNIIFEKNKLIFATLRVKGDYFSDREAITFNKDEFIGFCGWADDNNTKPIIYGFMEWCDYLKNSKVNTCDKPLNQNHFEIYIK